MRRMLVTVRTNTGSTEVTHTAERAQGQATRLPVIQALVAQGIEHRFPKPGVAGSNPAEGAAHSEGREPSDPLWIVSAPDHLDRS